MRKIDCQTRSDFLRGLQRHLYSISRKRKYYDPRENTKPDTANNPLLSYFFTMSHRQFDPRKKMKDGFIAVPKKFSLYDKPEEALAFIHKVTTLISKGDKKTVALDYSRTTEYCLGAECLLGLAVREARKNNQNINGSVLVNGIYPINANHLEIIRDVGVVKEIGEAEDTEIEDHSEREPEQKQHIFIETSIGYEGPSAFAQDKKNKTSSNFAAYINSCLNDHGLELKDEASRHLQSCMAEMLDNAERHCGENERPRWYVRGHVNNSLSKPTCELSIFNFGKTIPDTFKKLPKDHFSFNIQVKPYIEKHLKKRDMFWDGLATIAALQGRVSCKNVTEEDSCGTGTIELLKLFQDMHDSLQRFHQFDDVSPVMSILSGATHIKFDGKYKLICKVTDSNGEKFTYPFNNVGLEKEPDRGYLKQMRQVYFPGVMINIRFPLVKTEKV
ncbi:Uncharacterised protein [Serratia proteamaculans]|nr:Uncharacterised protein [Serratia proteamaculans]